MEIAPAEERSQADNQESSSSASRMPGQPRRSNTVYKPVGDGVMAPGRENITVFEHEETMSVAQFQRSDVRIGQSVCDGVMAPGRENITIFEYEETMGVAQLQRGDVRIGQSDMHERNGQSVDIQSEVN